MLEPAGEPTAAAYGVVAAEELGGTAVALSETALDPGADTLGAAGSDRVPASSLSELGETAKRGLAGLSQMMAGGGAARLPSILASPVYGVARRRRRWYS